MPLISGRRRRCALAAASAVACRSRASMMATSTSSRCTRAPRYRLRPVLQPCACAGSGAHMHPDLSAWRIVRGLDPLAAHYSPVRGYSTHTHWRSALVRQRLGGVGGAPVHAQRNPAQQTAKRPLPRDDARAAEAAPSTVCFAKASRKQASKQTNKQASKQANKQTNSVEPNRGSGAAAASRCARATRGRHDATCALRVPISDCVP